MIDSQNSTAIRRYFDVREAAGERLPTQDRMIYSLLRLQRLLEPIYQ